MVKSTVPDRICSLVARSIREERARKNLSLNVLSARAGLSRQMVSYVEQEMRKPTLDTLLRICDVLEIPVEELIANARKAVIKSPKKSMLK